MHEMIEELRCLIAEQSIRHGEFTLASGARSHYYCDLKATTQSPRGSLLVGEILYPIFRDLDIDAVGGLAMGSVFLSAAVSLVSAQRGRPIHGFFVRTREKDHGLKLSVEEAFFPGGESLLGPGRKVAIVEDVVTKGGSIQKAIEAVQARGCEIRSVLALVDRQAGGGDLLRAKGLPYTAIYHTDEAGGLHLNDEYRGDASGPSASLAVS
jgi:orotate phosphoribosyltransferase